MSAGYTTTKYHRLSHRLGGWKSEIRTPAWWGSGESSLPSWQVTALTMLSHGEEKEGSSWVSPLTVVQLLSCVQLFATHGQQHAQASLSFTVSQSLLKLMSTESMMPSNHFILCCPFLLLPSIFPSLRVFPVSWFFTSGGKVLELQLQYQSFL